MKTPVISVDFCPTKIYPMSITGVITYNPLTIRGMFATKYGFLWNKLMGPGCSVYPPGISSKPRVREPATWGRSDHLLRQLFTFWATGWQDGCKNCIHQRYRFLRKLKCVSVKPKYNHFSQNKTSPARPKQQKIQGGLLTTRFFRTIVDADLRPWPTNACA